MKHLKIEKHFFSFRQALKDSGIYLSPDKRESFFDGVNKHCYKAGGEYWFIKEKELLSLNDILEDPRRRQAARDVYIKKHYIILGDVVRSVTWFKKRDLLFYQLKF